MGDPGVGDPIELRERGCRRRGVLVLCGDGVDGHRDLDVDQTNETRRPRDN